MLHIGRNIFSLIFSRVVTGIVLFLVYTRLVQYLGPEAAGQYGLLASYMTVFSFFIDLGMSQLVIKKISEDKTHASKYLNNYFSTQFLLALSFMLIMDVFVYFAGYPAIVKNSLYITSIGLLLTTMSLPFRSVVNAFQKLTTIAWINMINSGINVLFMVLAVVLKLDIYFLAFITVAIGLFDWAVYGFLVHKKFTPFRLEFDKAFVKQLFVLAWPFTMLTFFSIYNRVDGLILPHLRSFVENGYYSAVYKFWDTLAFIPGVIGIALYPFFAEMLSKQKKDQVRTGLEVYTRYMIAAAVPMSAGAYLLAKPLTLALYGADFLPAAPALWLLVLAVSVLFVYSPANSLIISQLTKTATKITGFTLLFNITANLIFIPKYGFVAAAVVTVLSETIQMVGYWYFIRKKVLDYHFFRFFVKPLIAAAVMGLAVVLFQGQNVFAVVGIAGIVYLAALLLMKFFQKSDWELFRAAVDFRKKIAVEEEIPEVKV